MTANARMIAAAPDLLEAICLIVAGIENSVSATYIPLVKAREAIAKATMTRLRPNSRRKTHEQAQNPCRESPAQKGGEA